MEHDLKKSYRYKEGYPQIVRYADDFVIFHEKESGILKAKKVVEEWVKEIGLELKSSKTRFSHTLQLYEGNVGFDFLGFTVRQFSVGKHKSSRNTHGKILGFKVIIRPSKKTVKNHITETKRIIRKHRSSPQEALIAELNAVVRGWANSYRTQASKHTFETCDHSLWRQLMRWAKYRQKGGTRKQMEKKYWKDGKVTANEKYQLRMHSETRIIRHIKVERSEEHTSEL